MNLIFREIELGEITEIGQDGPEMWATYKANSNSTPFLEMWKFITDEENYDIDPPFPSEYLEDESWFIEGEQGDIHPISLPAVYEDGVISWRWRDAPQQ